MRKRLFRVVSPIAAAVLLLVTWHVVVVWGKVSPIILPTPGAVAFAFAEEGEAILIHSLWTLLEAASGFLLATAVGLIGATIFVLVPRLSDAIYPLVVALKMVPMIALAPLIVVWFGTGFMSKTIMAGTVAFFPVLVNALKGLRNVSTDEHDLFETLSAKRWQILWKLRLPSAVGYTFAALRVSAVFAVIGAVVAEFIGASKGIGYFVKSASYYSETDSMLAGILATALVGGALYGSTLMLERLSPRWQWAIGRDPVV